MRRWLLLGKRFLLERKAATSVEYAMIIAMIVLAMFGALQAAGSQTISIWNNISSKVVAAK